MIKLVPIAIELEIARAKPMYLSPGETEEISPPLIASVPGGIASRRSADN